MLTSLHLKNFKSWKDTGAIRLRPITGLFGANSSGKTSLLQSILLMKQTADSPDRGSVFHYGGQNTPTDIGDFQSMIYNHDYRTSELEIALHWKSRGKIEIVDAKYNDRSVVSGSDLNFLTQIKYKEKTGASVEKLSYGVGQAIFGMKRKNNSNEYNLFVNGVDNSAFDFVRSVGRAWPLPHPVKSYGFPDQVRGHYQNAGFLSDLELAFEDQLRRVYYLGPLRAYPERRYVWSGGQPFDMGRAGEQTINAILSSRGRGEKISRGRGRSRLNLEEYVAWWLKELGLIYDFRIQRVSKKHQVFEVMVKKNSQSKDVLITDVGFGVSQILPVLVICFYAEAGSTIILEQPEIHLHPSVQAGLADVLIDAHEKRGVQILLESHSEHLLRRLQRRIAEKKICRDKIGLYFCSTKGGRSGLTKLEIDVFSNITNWPKDFWGDEFGEIVAIAKAQLDGKKAHQQ